MTLTAEFAIRCIVALAISIAISCACYAVLSLFIWTWLSFILALIASYYIEGTEVVVAAKITACNAAVAGAATALNWYRSLRGNVEVAA